MFKDAILSAEWNHDFCNVKKVFRNYTEICTCPLVYEKMLFKDLLIFFYLFLIQVGKMPTWIKKTNKKESKDLQQNGNKCLTWVSFNIDEQIHKKKSRPCYIVSANHASSVTLWDNPTVKATDKVLKFSEQFKMNYLKKKNSFIPKMSTEYANKSLVIRV